MRFSCSICVYMDCQTVVKQFQQLRQTLNVDLQWSHQLWWHLILEQLQLRLELMDDPIQVEWIPAHVCEQIPVHLIPPEVLTSKKTTIRHIHLNRVADRHAREAASSFSAVAPEDQNMLYNAVLAKQKWLAQLAELIYCDYHTMQKEAREGQSEEQEQQAFLSGPDCRNWYPTLSWDMEQNHFLWTAAPPTDMRNPKPKQIAPASWEVVKGFTINLCWKVDAALSISFVELALIFHLRGYRIPDWQSETKTFRELVSEIRKIFMYMKTHADGSFFPGTWQKSLNRSYGKCLPAGTITGATPWLSNAELEIFSNLLYAGAGKNLCTWSWFLDDERFHS